MPTRPPLPRAARSMRRCRRSRPRAGLCTIRRWSDEPPLEIVVALHIGTAIYGNIGAADRLDFTVIGPAVNLVSRIEAVAKALDQPIVVSDDFARAYDGPLQPLGRHELRGLATPHDLFAPIA